MYFYILVLKLGFKSIPCNRFKMFVIRAAMIISPNADWAETQC